MPVVLDLCNLDLGRHVCRVTANTASKKRANNELMGQAIECSFFLYTANLLTNAQKTEIKKNSLKEEGEAVVLFFPNQVNPKLLGHPFSC